MKFPVRVLAVAFLLTSACSHVPIEASNPLSYQKKLQAPDHWKTISFGVSNEVKAKMEMESEDDRRAAQLGLMGEFGYSDPNIASPTNNLKLPAGYFGPICISEVDKSDFGKSLRVFLKTEFSNKGIPVACPERQPYLLEWEVSINKTNAARRNYNPGVLELLVDVPQFILFGGNDSETYKPHHEVIVTFLLTNKYADTDTPLLRKSNIYYINDEDVNQYWVTTVDHTPKVETISKRFIMTNNN